MGLMHLIATNVLSCVRILFWEPDFGYLGSKSLTEKTSFQTINSQDPMVIYEKCFSEYDVNNGTVVSNLWVTRVPHILSFMIHYRYKISYDPLFFICIVKKFVKFSFNKVETGFPFQFGGFCICLQPVATIIQ